MFDAETYRQQAEAELIIKSLQELSKTAPLLHRMALEVINKQSGYGVPLETSSQSEAALNAHRWSLTFNKHRKAFETLSKTLSPDSFNALRTAYNQLMTDYSELLTAKTQKIEVSRLEDLAEIERLTQELADVRHKASAGLETLKKTANETLEAKQIELERLQKELTKAQKKASKLQDRVADLEVQRDQLYEDKQSLTESLRTIQHKLNGTQNNLKLLPGSSS